MVDRIADAIRNLDITDIEYLEYVCRTAKKETLARNISDAIQAARDAGFTVEIDTDNLTTTIDNDDMWTVVVK